MLHGGSTKPRADVVRPRSICSWQSYIGRRVVLHPDLAHRRRLEGHPVLLCIEMQVTSVERSGRAARTRKSVSGRGESVPRATHESEYGMRCRCFNLPGGPEAVFPDICLARSVSIRTQ